MQVNNTHEDQHFEKEITFFPLGKLDVDELIKALDNVGVKTHDFSITTTMLNILNAKSALKVIETDKKSNTSSTTFDLYYRHILVATSSKITTLRHSEWIGEIFTLPFDDFTSSQKKIWLTNDITLQIISDYERKKSINFWKKTSLQTKLELNILKDHSLSLIAKQKSLENFVADYSNHKRSLYHIINKHILIHQDKDIALKQRLMKV